MPTLREFKKQLKPWVEHDGFSNIDVRAHFDCPNCKANLLLLWHFYPELFLKYGGTANSGFHFHNVEYYRLPTGEVIENKLY